jgi:hypothetical protein
VPVASHLSVEFITGGSRVITLILKGGQNPSRRNRTTTLRKKRMKKNQLIFTDSLNIEPNYTDKVTFMKGHYGGPG